MIQGAVSKKRWILQAVMGFLLGRVWLFSMNPFAIAYICASGVYPGSRTLVLFSVLAGVLTKARGLDFVQYVVLISLTGFVQYIMRKIDGREGSVISVACVSGILNFILGTATGVITVNTIDAIWMSLLESLCMIALANVFQWGIRFLLYEDWEKILGNEELISMISLTALAVYGMPRTFDGVFSIAEMLHTLCVLRIYSSGAKETPHARIFPAFISSVIVSATSSGSVFGSMRC